MWFHRTFIRRLHYFVRPKSLSLKHALFALPRYSSNATKSPLMTRLGDRINLLRTQRCYSSLASTYDANSSASATETKLPTRHPKREPSYELTFTCKPCGVRSSNHAFTKHAYHHGSVLITCPGCKARHIIADHLKMFSDANINIEDLMRRNGDLVKHGRLEAGDVEFWDDGSVIQRPHQAQPNEVTAPT